MIVLCPCISESVYVGIAQGFDWQFIKANHMIFENLQSYFISQHDYESACWDTR